MRPSFAQLVLLGLVSALLPYGAATASTISYNLSGTFSATLKGGTGTAFSSGLTYDTSSGDYTLTNIDAEDISFATYAGTIADPTTSTTVTPSLNTSYQNTKYNLDFSLIYNSSTYFLPGTNDTGTLKTSATMMMGGTASTLANLTVTKTGVSAVPLPASFPLLASGLMGLGLFARRRRNRA